MTIAGKDQINAFRLISGFIQSAQNRSKSPLSSFQVSTLVILNKFLLNYCLQESLWQMPEAGRSPRRHPGWLPTTANGWWQSGKESLYRILLCARVHHTRWPSSGLLCQRSMLQTNGPWLLRARLRESQGAKYRFDIANISVSRNGRTRKIPTK